MTGEMAPEPRTNLPRRACIETGSSDGRGVGAGNSRSNGTGSPPPPGQRHDEPTDTRTDARAVQLPERDGGRIASLVARSKAGDREAFGLLYSEYRGRIFNLARFSLPRSLAEDAVGETFVRAWAALPRYERTGAPFVAWLYGIARHVVADFHRHSARVELQEPDEGEALDTEEYEIDCMVLRSGLDRLPEEQRVVIELKFLAGLSNEEVGAVLGKSPGAVNTQQWRALSALRSFMDGEQ